MDAMTIAVTGFKIKMAQLGPSVVEVYNASLQNKAWEKANSQTLVMAKKTTNGWTQKVQLSKAVKEGWIVIGKV
jgi:hypothetical protein